ncbi:MAG: protein-disulfide reductase DsbD domain-containing protein, partial [Bacteroidota bacterium]
MNRIISILGLALWMVVNGNAQVADPVKWTFSHEKTGEMEVELIFKATIDYPWHLYSAHLPEGGPIATKPWFNESDAYTLVGEIVEVTKSKKKYDEGFQMEVGTISGKAELRQKVKLNAPGTHTITGEIEFQTCDDVTCLPPKTDEFSFTITTGGTGASVTADQSGTETVTTGGANEEETAAGLSGLIQKDDPGD